MCIDYFLADILNPANSSPIEAQVKMLNRHGLQLMGSERRSLPLSEAIDCEHVTFGLSFKDFLEELEQVTDDLKLRISDDLKEDGMMKHTIKSFIKGHLAEIDYLLATKSSRNYSLVLFLLASLCSKRIKLYCVTNSKISSQSFGPKSEVTVRLLRMNDSFLNLTKIPGNSINHDLGNKCLAVSRFRESRLVASELKPANSTSEESTIRVNNSLQQSETTSLRKFPLSSANSQDHQNLSEKSFSSQKLPFETVIESGSEPKDLVAPCDDPQTDELSRHSRQGNLKHRFQSANQSSNFGMKTFLAGNH